MTPRRLLLGAVVVWVVAGCEGRRGDPPVPTPTLVANSQLPAPAACASASSSAPAAVSSSPPPSEAPPAYVCTSACAPGTACHLTTKGPACTVCDPEGLPFCKDDRWVATCKGDGTVVTTDCAARKQRCLNGACAPTVCEPGREHCHEGRLFRCNAAGSARTLVQDCRAENDAGAIQICQTDVSPPACRSTCKSAKGVTLVLAKVEDCDCDWSGVPFCDQVSRESPCGTLLCAEGGIGGGATMLWCERETTGLVVPGTEKRGPCAGSGEIGAAKITYDVCRMGKPVATSRTVPCRK
jgi:hypothetical protein